MLSKTVKAASKKCKKYLLFQEAFHVSYSSSAATKICGSCTWMLKVYHKYPSDTYVTNKYTGSPSYKLTAPVKCTAGAVRRFLPVNVGPRCSGRWARARPTFGTPRSAFPEMPRRYIIAFYLRLYFSNKQDLPHVRFGCVWFYLVDWSGRLETRRRALCIVSYFSFYNYPSNRAFFKRNSYELLILASILVTGIRPWLHETGTNSDRYDSDRFD